MIFLNLLAIMSIPFSAFIVGIVIVKAPNQFNRIIWIFTYCMAMIAYCYSPTYVNDLARYYARIDYCRQLPFSEAFTWISDGLVIKNLLFWVLAKINQKNLLQAIAIGVMYGVSAFIACDASQESNNHFASLFIIILGLLPLFLAANNIRNMIAFALSILAIYRDLVKRNRGALTVFLYIVPCFIHMASVALLAGRLLLPLVKRNYRISLGALIAVPFLVVNLYPILRVISIPGNTGLIIRRLIFKSYSTVVGTSAYAISTRESGFNNACRIVMFLFCLLIACSSFQFLKTDSDGKSRFHDFILYDAMLCAFTCVYILTGAIKFWVFAVASVICAIPLLQKLYEGVFRCSLVHINVCTPISFLAAARASLEIYFMMSRVNWKELFLNILWKNGLVVFFQILRELML